MIEHQKMRLAIIELDYHAEILTFLCPLLANDFNLIILTTQKIWKKTEIPENEIGYDVRIKSKDQSYDQFFSSCENVLNTCDILYINTVGKGFNSYASRTFNCPTIVRIHNVNTVFDPVSHIQFRFSSLMKDISYYVRNLVIRQQWKRVRNFVNRADCILLPSRSILQISKDRGFLGSARYICENPLPLAYLGDALPYEPIIGTTVCAILGSVDPKRKDYDVVYKAVLKYKKNYSGKLVLKFLGGLKGKGGQQVIQAFLQLCDDQFSIVYNRDYIPKSELQRELKSVQFLVAPIKQATRFKIFKEQYGISKLSGAESDIINFQRPAIFSASYPLSGDLEKVTKVYKDDEDLCKKMNLMGQLVTPEYLQNSFATLNDYNPNSIRDEFSRLCKRLAKAEV